MPDREPVAGWSDLVPAALRLAARIPPHEPIAISNAAWPASDYTACGQDVLAALHKAHPTRVIRLHCAGAAMCGLVPNDHPH